MRYLIFFVWVSSLFSHSTHFDVVVVGTSPFSLLEALYCYHSGDRVLIVEQANDCGGAWKSLDVCGNLRVDLGCHQIGHDPELLQFLTQWVGCNMVYLNHPLVRYTDPDKNGYYFSEGSHELMDHLLKLIGKTEIVLLLNHRLESVKIDPAKILATLKINGQELTASKVVVPTYSDIRIENHPTIPFSEQGGVSSRFQHLYILVDDPLPPQFTYHGRLINEVSRIMNLTDFVHLTGTGKQLLAFQFYGDLTPQTAEQFVDAVKSQQLLSLEARILCVDSYVYEQFYYNRDLIDQISNGKEIFHILESEHLTNLLLYIPKWKMVLKPYKEALFSME